MIVAAGCGGRAIVVDDPADLQALNDDAAKGSSRVRMRNGEVYRAQDLSVDEQTTQWVAPRTHSSTDGTAPRNFEFPTAQVYSVEIRSSAAGAGKGFLYGALVGAGIGVLVGAIDSSSDGLGPPPELAAGIFFGVFGGGMGAFVGMLNGSWREYPLQSTNELPESDID